MRGKGRQIAFNESEVEDIICVCPDEYKNVGAFHGEGFAMVEVLVSLQCLCALNAARFEVVLLLREEGERKNGRRA